MKIEVLLPDSVRLDVRTTAAYKSFLQRMANRRVVGAIRYEDKPNRAKKYMTRLEKELQAYRHTGNVEHLLNIANYAFLESEAPEHKKQNFDPTAKSVTRKGKVN